MIKNIMLQLTQQEREICWNRVVENIIENLPEDYPFFDDVFELKELVEQIDIKIRALPKHYGGITGSRK